MVQVVGDVTKVSELQKGHGEWGHNTVLVGFNSLDDYVVNKGKIAWGGGHKHIHL